MTQTELTTEQIRRIELFGNVAELEEGYMVSVAAPEEEDDDPDSYLRDVRRIVNGPTGNPLMADSPSNKWLVEWAGSGNTDSTGETTEDIQVTENASRA